MRFRARLFGGVRGAIFRDGALATYAVLASVVVLVEEALAGGFAAETSAERRARNILALFPALAHLPFAALCGRAGAFGTKVNALLLYARIDAHVFLRDPFAARVRRAFVAVVVTVARAIAGFVANHLVGIVRAAVAGRAVRFIVDF